MCVALAVVRASWSVLRLGPPDQEQCYAGLAFGSARMLKSFGRMIVTSDFTRMVRLPQTTRGRDTRVPGVVQSVARACELLEQLANAGGQARLSEVAGRAGLPMATTHRLLQTLIGWGYARADESGRYSLGPRLVHIGHVAARVLGANLQPYLASLAEATGESANLALLDGDRAVYVAQAPSRQSMRMFTEVGRQVYLHSTGVGKAILANLSQEEVLARIGRAGLSPMTTATITELPDLLEQLRSIRQVGYAIDNEEQEVGVRCIAVPICAGAVSAAVSVSGPSARLDSKSIERVVPVLQAAARRIESTMIHELA